MSQTTPSRFSSKTIIRAVVVVNVILAGAALWFGNWGMAVLQGACAFVLFGLTVLIGALESADASRTRAARVAAGLPEFDHGASEFDFMPGYSASGALSPTGRILSSTHRVTTRQASSGQLSSEDLDTDPPLIEWVSRQCLQGATVDAIEARALVAAGADLAAVDDEGDNAYVLAALLNAPPEALDVLVELGVDPLADPQLLERMLEADPEVATLRSVLSHGLDVNATPSDQASLLEQAMDEGLSDEIIMCLIDAGADITVLTLADESLFVHAIEQQCALPTLLALVPFWRDIRALAAARARATDCMDWGLEDALVAASKHDEAADLMGPLVLAGAKPFAAAPAHDESAVAVLVETADSKAMLALAQALPMKDRYRLEGYIEALDDSFDDDGQLMAWIPALDELERAWSLGHGDEMSALPRLQGHAGQVLSEQLSLATGWAQVQRLVLAGADPMVSVNGQTPALEKALRAGEFHLAAMMLECFDSRQAKDIITGPWLTDDQQRVAMAWWEVRRQCRARYFHDPNDLPSSSPGPR